MLVTAVRLNATGEPIEAKYTFSDPTFETVTIPSGAVLSGQVDLNERFEEFEAAMQKGLLLFWSYQLKSVDGTCYPRTGGWIDLAKNKHKEVNDLNSTREP